MNVCFKTTTKINRVKKIRYKISLYHIKTFNRQFSFICHLNYNIAVFNIDVITSSLMYLINIMLDKSIKRR